MDFLPGEVVTIAPGALLFDALGRAFGHASLGTATTSGMIAGARRFIVAEDGSWFYAFPVALPSGTFAWVDERALLRAPPPSPASSYATGWHPAPHPIEYIPSVNPTDSAEQKARAVLYDFIHDDDLKNWFDGFKGAFKLDHVEDYDPTFVIQIYEHPSDPQWPKIKAFQDAGGITASYKSLDPTWKGLDVLVKGAVARRAKLGALPASNYGSEPVVIYYYDHDRMKVVNYPRVTIPDAINPDNHTWWVSNQGTIVIKETQDPAKIAAERAKPSGGANWDGEGWNYDKDWSGNIQGIVATVMMVVGTIVQVIPGVGTAVGTALIVGGAVIAAIAGAIDDAFHGKDNAGALAGIAKALLQAANAGMKAETGVSIPPSGMKALSATVDLVAADVSAAQQKRWSYTETWNSIAKKAATYGRLGDKEAHAIQVVLGENQAGRMFINGHSVGKLAQMPQIEAIAKIVQSYSTFIKDPKALNIFLLGCGIGHLTAHQNGTKPAILPKSKRAGSVAHQKKVFPHPHLAPTTNPHATRGDFALERPEFVGAAPRRRDASSAKDALAALVHNTLLPRYRGAPKSSEMIVAGDVTPSPSLSAPPAPAPDWSALGRGCPEGSWFDPFEGTCRPMSPVATEGDFADLEQQVYAALVRPPGSLPPRPPPWSVQGGDW